MASLLRILLEFLRILRPAKDHIKRLLRFWPSLLAYLVRKMGEWRFLWPSKPGTIRNPRSVDSSFPSDRAASSSVSGGPVCTGGIGGYAVAACTVPASANQPLGHERAEPQSDTTPSTPTLPTLSIDPSWALDPSTTNQTVGSSHANHSSGSLSFQSCASDRLSTMSISRTLSDAPVQDDRPSQDPRATYRQFVSGPGASRSRGRSSRSPSPKPSLNAAHPDSLDIAPTGAHSYARADGIINPASLQGLTDLPSSSSHTQEQPGRSAIRRQRTTSNGLTVKNLSTESLPTTSINAQEITEEPMTMSTHTLSFPSISSLDRADTASQNSHAASSATPNLVIPEGRVVQLITSDQIQRYTRRVTV